MLADLPRVEYGSDKITKADIEEAKERNVLLQERLKKGGGIGACMNKQVSTDYFMQSKLKGG